MTLYKKHLSEPWYSLIESGSKTCEGRLDKGDFKEMKIGDYIEFENNELNCKRLLRIKITSIKNYTTFEDYLKNETLECCLPGITIIEEGVNIYYQYYKKEDEELYGVKAIRFIVLL